VLGLGDFHLLESAGGEKVGTSMKGELGMKKQWKNERRLMFRRPEEAKVVELVKDMNHKISIRAMRR